MLCTHQAVNVLCQIKKKIRYSSVQKQQSTNTQVLMRLTRCRAHQTESNHCDILGSFNKEKVQAANYSLRRQELMAILLQKQGSWLKLNSESTSGCLPCLFLPLLSGKVSSNAAAPAFTSHAVQMSSLFLPLHGQMTS